MSQSLCLIISPLGLMAAVVLSEQAGWWVSKMLTERNRCRQNNCGWSQQQGDKWLHRWWLFNNVFCLWTSLLNREEWKMRVWRNTGTHQKTSRHFLVEPSRLVQSHIYSHAAEYNGHIEGLSLMLYHHPHHHQQQLIYIWIISEIFSPASWYSSTISNLNSQQFLLLTCSYCFLFWD